MKPAGKFVWIKGLRGPVAEKWPHDMPAGGKTGKVVLDEHDLSADEFALRIAILEQRYPPPKSEPPAPETTPPPPAPKPTAPAAMEKVL
jgi:hypothetical protein